MTLCHVGDHFTLHVPPNRNNFDGLVERCEVLECEPPSRLAFSCSVGAPITFFESIHHE
jgi:hypothetical protein